MALGKVAAPRKSIRGGWLRTERAEGKRSDGALATRAKGVCLFAQLVSRQRAL